MTTISETVASAQASALRKGASMGECAAIEAGYRTAAKRDRSKRTRNGAASEKKLGDGQVLANTQTELAGRPAAAPPPRITVDKSRLPAKKAAPKSSPGGSTESRGPGGKGRRQSAKREGGAPPSPPPPAGKRGGRTRAAFRVLADHQREGEAI